MASVERSLPQADASATATAKGINHLARLRLVTGSTLILVSLVGMLGADWDIQWHAVIGRDRTFTPPHDLILIGIGASGIVALISILIETAWFGQHPGLRSYGTDFLGVLRSSLGSYLVGFGAVCSAVAFPLDTYWHSLYGIDVSLWAPFHTMIYMGSVLSTFGMVYLLLSSAHLAQDHKTEAFSYVGVVVVLGILLSKFSTFLTPAISGHAVHLSAVTVSLFPFLMAMTAVFVCVLAVRLVHWVGAATMVVVVFLLVLLLISAFVPPLMTQLVQAEHQTYLARASHIGSTIIPLEGQTPILLLLSLSIDGVVWLGRQGKWTLSTLNKWVVVAVMVGMILVASFTLVQMRLGVRVTHGGGRGGHAAQGLLLAVLLTIPGSLLGTWLAGTIEKTMQALWR